MTQEAAFRIQEALMNALPYVEDVLSNSEILSGFKKGTVEKDAKSIRAAINDLENTSLL